MITHWIARIVLLLSMACLTQSQGVEAATALISPEPILHFSDNNGFPCVGCKLFTYIAGTTSKVTTFTASDAGTPNTNPIILNARGEANVWLNPAISYKFILAPATDTDPPTNPFWTVDNLNSPISSGALVAGSSTISSNIITVSVAGSSPNTQTLPASPVIWETHIINDAGCNASTNQITISGNGHNIDAYGASYIMAFNCQSVMVQWNGTLWKLEAINEANIPSVPTIAALRALGSASSFYPNISVASYATPGDGGGGALSWFPADTASADNCIIFSVSGVTTGRYRRALNGAPFNADMCGTGSSDDSSAINNAFTVCVSYVNLGGSVGIPLFFSSKSYKVNSTLTVPTGCTFHGAGGKNFAPFRNTMPETIFDFRSAPNTVSVLMSIVGLHGPADYDTGGSWGDFQILDAHSVPRTGLYISSVAQLDAENITVLNVLGTGIFLGNEEQAYYRGLYVYGSGTSTNSPLDIDGEVSGGTEFVSTTTSLYDTRVETDGGAGATCGISINRNANLLILGGDSEAAGINMCIGNKSGSQIGNGNIVVQDFDMEDPTNGATSCVDIGAGWTGTPPQSGEKTVQVSGTLCIANSSTAFHAFHVQNSDGFWAQNNAVLFSNSSQGYFDFEGTNTNEAVGPNAEANASPGAFDYVTVDGAVRKDSVINNPWNISDINQPVTYLSNTTTSGSVTITPTSSVAVQEFTVSLTGDLSVTIATTGALPGFRSRIVSPSNLNGHSFTVNSVSIGAGHWIEFDWNGAAYRETASGSIL